MKHRRQPRAPRCPSVCLGLSRRPRRAHVPAARPPRCPCCASSSPLRFLFPETPSVLWATRARFVLTSAHPLFSPRFKNPAPHAVSAQKVGRVSWALQKEPRAGAPARVQGRRRVRQDGLLLVCFRSTQASADRTRPTPGGGFAALLSLFGWLMPPLEPPSGTHPEPCDQGSRKADP